MGAPADTPEGGKEQLKKLLFLCGKILDLLRVRAII
nr:MAG TPA: hypothetical protein [Caudoviricetes sp.]